MLHRPAGGTWLLSAESTAPEVLTVAHRGASGHAPENTLEAVRLGVRQHADLVEVDVHQTRDRVPVVMHDATLERTTDARHRYPDRSPWRIRDFSYHEIRQLDAGSWFDSRYAGARVPTLAAVLDLLGETGTGLFLEVKSPSQYPDIGRRVAEQIHHRDGWGTDRPLVVGSFDWAFVRDYKRRIPATTTAVIGTPRYGALARIAGYADLVNPQYGTVNATYLRRVHQLGMRSYGWTVDVPAEMRRLIELGSDGVITNLPDVLHEIVSDRRLAA